MYLYFTLPCHHWPNFIPSCFPLRKDMVYYKVFNKLALCFNMMYKLSCSFSFLRAEAIKIWKTLMKTRALHQRLWKSESVIISTLFNVCLTQPCTLTEFKVQEKEISQDLKFLLSSFWFEQVCPSVVYFSWKSLSYSKILHYFLWPKLSVIIQLLHTLQWQKESSLCNAFKKPAVFSPRQLLLSFLMMNWLSFSQP